MYFPECTRHDPQNGCGVGGGGAVHCAPRPKRSRPLHNQRFLPDDATFAKLAALPDDDPVVMVNLIEFADDGGEAYAPYGRTAGPQ